MRRAPGFTLLEMLFALGLTTVVASGVWQLWTHGARLTGRLGSGTMRMQEARLDTKALINELEEGLQLFYPAPGRKTQQGLGFLNARGEVILYYEKEASDLAGKSIWRANLTEDREKEVEVVRSVRHFNVTALPAAQGKEASCVTLDISLFSESSGQTVTGELTVATSVFLRGLERDIPEDPTP